MGDDQPANASSLADDEVLRRMYRITADPELQYEQKLPELLALGREYLGVEAGFVTKIEDGTQRIIGADSSHERIQTGVSCPLSEAYCRRTVEQSEPLTIQHASIEGWEDDAAYEAFGLESYIGATVVLDGEMYGTFCFADTEPRDQPFSSNEETFVELLSQWMSYELFRERAIDRIREQRDQLDQFAGMVSHDLRNPLGVAQGYLDLAERSGDPEDFERCRTALQHMSDLIDDLLRLAREGETVSDAEAIVLTALVDEAWDLVPTEDATIEVATDVVVSGDWTRLQQLFGNLFRNAVEHGSTSPAPEEQDAGEHGGPEVHIRVGVLPDAEGIYVEDDGPGIDEADRGQVFDDGYSTDDAGTGYGLAIVAQIADAHGWSVRVTESDTGGARFEFTGVTFVDE
jgi:signal transduction histidine kinase